MHNTAVVLETRVKGLFNISIATSLAFEGLFGIMQENQPKDNPSFNIFDEIWVNVRTLFRNINGSIDQNEEGRLVAEDYYNALLEEIILIQAFVKEYKADLKVNFYVNTYQTLTRMYPFAYFKDAKTDKQKEYSTMENNAILLLFKHFGKDNGILHQFDVSLRFNGGKTLLLTHYPVDILNAHNYRSLGLLESHTGVVKSKAAWNTKLKGGATIRIPFDRLMIQLFGESGGLFLPYPLSTRKRILELSVKHNWNGTTTPDTVKRHIKEARDPLLEQLVTKLY